MGYGKYFIPPLTNNLLFITLQGAVPENHLLLNIYLEEVEEDNSSI